MGITVLAAVTQILHQFGRRIAQMFRHRPRLVVAHQFTRAVVRHVRSIAFRRDRQIQRNLRQRQFTFGCTKALVGFAGIERHAQCACIGKTDILHRHADQPPAEIQRISAAIEHAHQPIQRGIRRRTAHGFMQRRDLVVKRIATLVETAQALRQRLLNKRIINFALFALRGRCRHLLHHVQQAAGIAIGIGHQTIAGGIR